MPALTWSHTALNIKKNTGFSQVFASGQAVYCSADFRLLLFVVFPFTFSTLRKKNYLAFCISHWFNHSWQDWFVHIPTAVLCMQMAEWGWDDSTKLAGRQMKLLSLNWKVSLVSVLKLECFLLLTHKTMPLPNPSSASFLLDSSVSPELNSGRIFCRSWKFVRYCACGLHSWPTATQSWSI